MPLWYQASDYCNAVLATAPKTTTDRLQRVLNAAAGVVSDTRKFDHGLSWLMYQELHWLDIPEWVSYQLSMLTNLTHLCLLSPVYLLNHCILVVQVTTRRNLHSAAHHQLTILWHRLSTCSHWAFAVTGPMTFNALPNDSSVSTATQCTTAIATTTITITATTQML